MLKRLIISHKSDLSKTITYHYETDAEREGALRMASKFMKSNGITAENLRVSIETVQEPEYYKKTVH